MSEYVPHHLPPIISLPCSNDPLIHWLADIWRSLDTSICIVTKPKKQEHSCIQNILIYSVGLVEICLYREYSDISLRSFATAFLLLIAASWTCRSSALDICTGTREETVTPALAVEISKLSSIWDAVALSWKACGVPQVYTKALPVSTAYLPTFNRHYGVQYTNSLHRQVAGQCALKYIP
ncbi:hypothetical protein BGX38DRAFT_346654 [Terfezia claveryi]|nr:hypothetical protein BGX38DRAFT_346654 [Terfezia claveryi]